VVIAKPGKANRVDAIESTAGLSAKIRISRNPKNGKGMARKTFQSLKVLAIEIPRRSALVKDLHRIGIEPITGNSSEESVRCCTEDTLYGGKTELTIKKLESRRPCSLRML
jgi:hypothetical protein